MPLISSSIPNLVNGISQQPPTLRLASQAEKQENGLSTVAQGLKKRPPSQHVKRLSNTLPGSAYIHTINRDSVERYEVVLTNGDLKVYDINGVQKTVNFPDGTSYLTVTDAATQFRLVTINDYTFVVNNTVTVQASSTLAASRPFESLINVKVGLYSKIYNVIINGSTVATFTTPDGTLAAHAAQISTDNIAAQLVPGLNAAGFSTQQYGSVIYISKATDYTIATTDGFNNAAMNSVKRQIQRFSDLPANAGQQDFTVEIVGDKTSEFDNYWVRFDKSNGPGVWRETRAPGISVGLNQATMPWGLIRNMDGTFTFKKLVWTDRLVGDSNSAPHPSFVGRVLRDIFFFRNRIGLLANENVIFSEAGSFFNFYPTTVTDLLDSDPIDVAASHNKVSNLNFAVPFNKQLLLFSSQTQFVVDAGDLLTPRTVSIKPTTEFECSSTAAPIGVGRNVYFAIPKKDYEGIREYYVVDTADTNDASDVTGHVPKYIPKGIYKLSAATNEDLLCALTSAERNVIYVYKFFWNNNQKLQSSWSKWVFESTDQVLSAEFIQSELFVVINRPSGLYLEKISVALGVDSGNEPYTVHLDRKQTISKAVLTYVSPYTIIPTNSSGIGWVPNDGSYMAIVATGQPEKAGVAVSVVWDGVNAKVLGDFTDSDLIVGRKYNFKYQLSPLMVRTTKGDAQQADTIARLQLRNLQINFADTGYFKAEVTPYGRSTYTYKYTGKTIGLNSSTIGQVGIDTGSFQFPIQAQNTTVDIVLSSDSPLPCSLLSADWEGYYVRRSQAV